MSVTVDAYPLGRSDAEARRLILQHQVYSSITRQFLMTAGIARGMKVLDMGSGAGDVAMLCADLVGPQGTVVGVDAKRGHPRLRAAARRGDGMEQRGVPAGRHLGR